MTDQEDTRESDMERIEKTIGEYITENAGKYGDRTAIEFPGFTCSFRELDQITDLLAVRLLDEWGIRKGTHVGIWSVNTPEFLFLFLAMIKMGAVPVPLNTCYQEEEISGILNSMDIRVLFYGSGWKDLVYEELLPGIRRLSPGVEAFVPIAGLSRGEHLSLSDFPKGAKSEGPAACKRLREEVRSRDVACIMMTSGTTRLPKGVMLTHYNIVNDGLEASACMHWSDRDKNLLVLPFFHCFGLITGAVGSVLNGMQMFMLPYFSTAAVWDAIENRGCTVLNGVPSVFLALIRKPEYKDRRSDNLTSGIIGGSVLRVEDYLDICSHFPKMHLQPSYGMTEGSPSVSFPDWDTPLPKKAQSCGKLMDGIEGRIRDIHTGESLPPGQEGELCLRGVNIMEAYYNMPEETKEAFTSDGFLRTGDIGYFNEEGELFISGRLKEMIIRAGENISVVEIENRILDSGLVKEVKVVGVPSDFRQEEIAALVVPADPERFEEEALRRYLAAHLAVFKIPDMIFTVERLPYTGSGKIDLKAAKELAERLLAAEKIKNKNKK